MYPYKFTRFVFADLVVAPPPWKRAVALGQSIYDSLPRMRVVYFIINTHDRNSGPSLSIRVSTAAKILCYVREFANSSSSAIFLNQNPEKLSALLPSREGNWAKTRGELDLFDFHPQMRSTSLLFFLGSFVINAYKLYNMYITVDSHLVLQRRTEGCNER